MTWPKARTGAIALFVLWLSGSGPAHADESVQITFVLTNDIYQMAEQDGRGGFARLGAVVRAERAAREHVFFAHAGDTLSPSLMSGFDQGEHILALTNMIAPDVFVPGNHEFDFGKDVFLRRMAEADFPLLAANMRQADGSVVPGFRDRFIMEIGSVRVGVLGIALAATPTVSSPGDLLFLPELDTVAEQAGALRKEGADLIIAVAHTGFDVDTAIQRAHLVDLLLTGHDHDLRVMFDGRTAVVESSAEARYVTAVDVTVRIEEAGDQRKVSWWPEFRIIDTATVSPSPEIGRAVTRYEAVLGSELDVALALLAAPLDSRRVSVRSRETAIGNLIADALRDATGADAAIMNGGGIRGNREYPAGHTLTRRDILTELPFGNRTVITRISGSALRSALEHGIGSAESPSGGFAQVSNLRVVVDRTRAPGTRLVSAQIGGQPLEDAATYIVATNNFLLNGGDGYTMLGGGAAGGPDAGGRLLANDVMVFVRKLGTINYHVEERILFN